MIKKMIVLPGGSVAAERAFFARSVWARTRGMIGRRFQTAPFEAMVFENCSAVHCCWMIEKIDVIFVSEEFEVVKVCANVRPWSVVCGGKGAKHTVEIAAGRAESLKLKPGVKLAFMEVDDTP